MSWIISRLARLNWRIVALALFSVGILHIIATISASELTDHPGYKKLTDDLETNKMKVLPTVTPDHQPLDFMSPDVRFALCKYDTSQGAVEIEAELPDNTWTVALHTPNGENIFTASGQDQGAEVFKIKLVPSPDRFAGLTPEARGASENRPAELTVVAQKGVAIIRGPIKGISYTRAIEKTLNRATCRVVPDGR